MGIHFTRFDSGKSVGLLSLYYHEFMKKVEERKGKKYLMVYDYLLDIWFYEILIDTNDKLADEFTLENVVILIVCCNRWW